jgi:hypothetical protein
VRDTQNALLEAASALRLAGRWAEAAALLAAADDDRPELLLAAAEVAVDQAFWQRTGLEPARAAVAAARQLGDARVQPSVRLLACQLDYCAARFGQADPTGQPATAASLLTELEAVRAAAADLSDEGVQAWAWFWTGLVEQALTGDLSRAEPALREAEATGQRLGDELLVSYATRHLAWVAAEQGRPVEALQRFDRSLELRLRADFAPGIAAARLALAQELVRQRRDPAEARRQARDARAIFQSLGVDWLAREAARLVDGLQAEEDRDG